MQRLYKTFSTLFFLTLVPFASAAGYTLDISETDDDKDEWGWRVRMGDGSGETVNFFVDDNRFGIAKSLQITIDRDQNGEPELVHLHSPDKTRTINLHTDTSEQIYFDLYLALADAETIHSQSFYLTLLEALAKYDASLTQCELQTVMPTIPFLQMLVADTQLSTVTAFFQFVEDAAAFSSDCYTSTPDQESKFPNR